MIDGRTIHCDRCGRAEIALLSEHLEDVVYELEKRGQWRIESAYTVDDQAEDLCPRCYSRRCNVRVPA